MRDPEGYMLAGKLTPRGKGQIVTVDVMRTGEVFSPNALLFRARGRWVSRGLLKELCL